LPVFALLQLLVLRRYGKDTRAALPLASDAENKCLTCVSDGVATGRVECISACVEAALQLPAGRDLRGAGAESRGKVAALRSLLLQHGESELRVLGVRGLWDLGQLGVWAMLHELQHRLHGGACPEEFFLFRTNAVPAYSICTPLLAGAERIHERAHFLDVLMDHGRWRDCDLLHHLAESTGMLSNEEAVAVDVGFNYGACTAYLLAMGVKVHALDISAEAAAVLRGATWEAEDRGDLTVHIASASDLERPGTAAAVAPTVRLDRLLSAEPGPFLLKIDVEGDEQAVLLGAFGLFATRRVRAVHVELHRQLLQEMGVDPWEPLNLLIKVGFHVEILPWHASENETRFDYQVTSKRGFRVLADKVEAREGANLQVIATLPPTLWKMA